MNAEGAPPTVRLTKRYAIGPLIARGSTSLVHRATDLSTGQAVALKLLDPRLCWDPEALERLRREVVVSRRVQHPGIVRVHELVVDNGQAAIVQELVEGESLAVLIGRERRLALERVLVIAQAVLEALAACHEQGVLHRDLKPSNVLLEASGRPRLIDFGVARVGLMTTVTHTGVMLGTPGYLAPEVLRGERPDLRCDLYGVGILLFEMLTGHRPFPDGDDGAPLFGQLWREAPELLAERRDVPPPLSLLVRRLLDAHPEMRPDGAYEVLQALIDPELVALAVAAGAGTACAECGHSNRRSLPFCAGCGQQERLVLRPGSWSVWLRGADRAEEYARHIEELFGAAVSGAELRRVLEGSLAGRVLASGLSEASALALAADARRFGAVCETKIGRLGLASPADGFSMLFGLGGSAITLVGLGQMVVARGLLTPAVALSFALALALFAAMVWSIQRERRPLLDGDRAVRSAKPGRLQYLAQGLAGRVARLSAGPLRTARAGGIEAYWEARLRLDAAVKEATVRGEAVRLLDRVLDELLQLTQAAADLTALLEGRSAAEAHQDLERARVLCRRQAQPGALVQLEQALAEEVRTLEAADDLVSAAAGRVVLAAGLLRRCAREVTRPSGAAATPLASLVSGFVDQADTDLAALLETTRQVRQAVPAALTVSTFPQMVPSGVPAIDAPSPASPRAAASKGKATVPPRPHSPDVTPGRR